MSKEQGSESAVSRSQYIEEEEMTEEKEAPRKLSRKDFVKGAAAVAGAGALASCAPAATPEPAPTCPPTPECPPAAECPPAEECAPCPVCGAPETWDEEADVVICGYGTAGMPAAIDAHDAGATVLIMEKLAIPGGSCRRCGGTIMGAGTHVQKEMGIEDSADDMYDYLVACGGGFADPALLRLWADNSGPNTDWLIEELGAEMPLVYTDGPLAQELLEPYAPGMKIGHQYYEVLGFEPVYRGHRVFAAPGAEGEDPWIPGKVTAGTGLFKAFDDAIKAREIRTMLETALIELVAAPDGEVLGVKALSGGNTLYIKARKGVVLATAGWKNNAKMVKDYVPITVLSPDGNLEVPKWITDKLLPERDLLHPDHDHGDGIIAGRAIGADLVNMWIYGSASSSTMSGGVRINPKAQVIDVYGDVIPRLYGAGMVTGGLYGFYDPQSGSHIAMCVSFGRIAGQNAAAEGPWA